MNKTIRSHHLRAMVVMALLTVLLLALVAAVETAETTFPSANGKIAHATNHDGKLEVHSMARELAGTYPDAADGLGRTNRTNKPDIDDHAAVVARWHQDNLQQPRPSHSTSPYQQAGACDPPA